MSLLPPDESVSERIAAAVEASVRTIDDTVPDPDAPTKRLYWQTPAFVGSVDFYDVQLLRDKYDLIYLVRLGDSFPGQRTSKQVDDRIDVFVLGAKLWKPASKDPFTPAGYQPRRTFQDRMEKDLRRRLEGEEMKAGVGPLGGLAYNVEINDIFRHFDIEGAAQWAVLELHFTVSARHHRSAA